MGLLLTSGLMFRAEPRPLILLGSFYSIKSWCRLSWLGLLGLVFSAPLIGHRCRPLALARVKRG